MTRKLLAGHWYIQVPAEQVQSGDWIEFFRQGYRVRQVQEVHLGRKHRYIRLKPASVPTSKNRTLKLEEVVRAWRRDEEGLDGRDT